MRSNDLYHYCVLFKKELKHPMEEKKSKKTKVTQKVSKTKGKSQMGEMAQSENEGRMDFGGLPDRDLKKNLGGCG